MLLLGFSFYAFRAPRDAHKRVHELGIDISEAMAGQVEKDKRVIAQQRQKRNIFLVICMSILFPSSIVIAHYGYAIYEVDAIIIFDIMAAYGMWNIVFVVDHMESVSQDMIAHLHAKATYKEVLKVIWEITALVSTLLLTVAAQNFGEDTLCNEENDCVGIPVGFMACNSMAFMQFLCGTLQSVIHTIYLTPLSDEDAKWYLKAQPGAPAAGLCWTCCGTGWLAITFYILNSVKYGFASALYFVFATGVAAVVVAHTALKASRWRPPREATRREARRRASAFET